MKRFLVVGASALVLSACAVPVPLQVASWVMDGVSLVATKKSLADHGLSAVAQQDCAIWRGISEGEVCRAVEDPVMLALAEPATRTEPDVIERVATAPQAVAPPAPEAFVAFNDRDTFVVVDRSGFVATSDAPRFVATNDRESFVADDTAESVATPRRAESTQTPRRAESIQTPRRAETVATARPVGEIAMNDRDAFVTDDREAFVARNNQETFIATNDREAFVTDERKAGDVTDQRTDFILTDDRGESAPVDEDTAVAQALAAFDTAAGGDATAATPAPRAGLPRLPPRRDADIAPPVTAIASNTASASVAPKAAPVAVAPKAAPVAVAPKAAPVAVAPKAAPVAVAPKAAPVTVAPKAAPVTVAPKAVTSPPAAPQYSLAKPRRPVIAATRRLPTTPRPFAAVPRPAPAAHPGEPRPGRYLVLASFRFAGNARGLRHRIRGLPTTILTARVGRNAVVYRVAVGPYAATEEQALRRRLAAVGFADPWAVRVRPGEWPLTAAANIAAPATQLAAFPQ